MFSHLHGGEKVDIRTLLFNQHTCSPRGSNRVLRVSVMDINYLRQNLQQKLYSSLVLMMHVPPFTKIGREEGRGGEVLNSALLDSELCW